MRQKQYACHRILKTKETLTAVCDIYPVIAARTLKMKIIAEITEITEAVSWISE